MWTNQKIQEPLKIDNTVAKKHMKPLDRQIKRMHITCFSHAALLSADCTQTRPGISNQHQSCALAYVSEFLYSSETAFDRSL